MMGSFDVPKLFQSFGIVGNIDWHEKLDRKVNISSTVFGVAFSIS